MIEIILTKENFCNQKDKLIEAIQSLEHSEEVLLVRNALNVMDKNAWFRFMRDKVGMIEDRRHYGTNDLIQHADWWEISYQPKRDMEMYAFSKTRQPYHTDNSWFPDPAPINFFAMEKQASKGGEQTIYPLSRLIDDLSKENKALLEKLMTLEVTIKRGIDDLHHKTTIIQGGAVPKIFWNYYRTQKENPEINNMCQEFFNFLEQKQLAKNTLTLSSQSADCFLFNDLKILHGRYAYEASEYQERLLYQSMWHLPDAKKYSTTP